MRDDISHSRWGFRGERLSPLTFMFGLGAGELILVLALALIFIGPEKLPDIATKAGKFYRQIRHALDDIKADIKNDLPK